MWDNLRMCAVGLFFVVAACDKSARSLEVKSFTVEPSFAEPGACTVIADLLPGFDSASVDLTLRACAQDRCSTPRGVGAGPLAARRTHTILYQLKECPLAPDRIEAKLKRVSEPGKPLPTIQVERFEETLNSDSTCSVRAIVRTSEPNRGTAVIVVARDQTGRPLRLAHERLLAQSEERQLLNWKVTLTCEQISSIDAQIDIDSQAIH